jgi:anaerobic selenocysteine-containing dehydrogenase
VQATQAMIDGRAKALICFGGNFAVAMLDHENGFPAMGNLDLSVHVGTKLNRTHLLVGKETFIFPPWPHRAGCSGHRSSVHHRRRLHVDGARLLRQAETRLTVTPFRTRHRRRHGESHLQETRVDWMTLVEDYDRIRDLIEQTIPGFEDYNARIRIPGGFRMPLPPTKRVWPTATGK